jgi:Wings apart-like protein regulation of heterochromatin
MLNTNECLLETSIVSFLFQLYTVVHNVKQAHECQEYGETQEFCDDIEYILDGLRSSQPVATRCLRFELVISFIPYIFAYKPTPQIRKNG